MSRFTVAGIASNHTVSVKCVNIPLLSPVFWHAFYAFVAITSKYSPSTFVVPSVAWLFFVQ
jgi:hypothetical protein